MDLEKTLSNINSPLQQNASIIQHDEIDLLELARSLWRQKALILGVSAFTTLSALLISFALPKTYSAEATLLPMSGGDSSAAFAAGIAAQLGPMASMLGGLSGNKSADLVEILSSRSMANRVITSYHLDKEVKGWKHRSELTAKLMKMTTIVAPTLKSKTLTIKVQAPSAELASKIANAYVTELKDMLDEIGYNSATKNRKFVEDQLTKTKTELAKVEEELTRFQATNQIASLPETVVASIRSVSELEAQRIGAAVEIQGTNEALDEVRSRIGALQATPETLTQLEIKRKSLAAQEAALANAQKTYLDKLIKLPPKAMALARLQRDVQVQNAIYLALTQQYQTALINESRDSESFLPLDRAETPIRPSKPRKQVNTLLGVMVGLVIGFISAILRESLQNRKRLSASS
ncbi:cryptic autophosphorylating protein tyrosine kinase Etk [compost metagenome]